MTNVYDYWRHRITGEIWAVELDGDRVVAAVPINLRDVNTALLPFLPYRHPDAGVIEQARHQSARSEGRVPTNH